MFSMQGSEKPRFLKKAQPTVFGRYFFQISLYLNGQLGSLLVDLPHHLKICKVITYWSGETET